MGAKLFDIGSKHLRKYLSTQAQDCQDASQHFHKDNVHSSILINRLNIFKGKSEYFALTKYDLQWKNFDKSLLKMQSADASTNSFLFVRESLDVMLENTLSG